MTRYVENTAGHRSRRFTNLADTIGAALQRFDEDWARLEAAERGNPSATERLQNLAEKLRLEQRLDGLDVATQWAKRRGLRTPEIRRRIK